MMDSAHDDNEVDSSGGGEATFALHAARVGATGQPTADSIMYLQRRCDRRTVPGAQIRPCNLCGPTNSEPAPKPPWVRDRS